MSFSSGTYSLPGPALNTGDTVSATENNTFRNDVATAFNLTMLRNGTSTATANLPMGGFKLTGLGVATASGDALSYGQAATVSDLTVTNSANLPNTFGFKNRIINGGMVIDQRNAGASVTPTNGQYCLDRFSCALTQASKFSVQQNAGSVALPAGFSKYLGITSLSAYSVAAGDLFSVIQYVEGSNVADLSWGTASASTVTISFWVRSSITGTFGGSVSNSAANRCYVFSYTINSANTWEYKTIAIPGDQSGTWLTDTGIGIRVGFSLGAGSTYTGAAGAWGSTYYTNPTGGQSVVGTNAATFYITGVQLEKGSTATSFDFRSIGTELALCQRYYWQSTKGANNPSIANGTLWTTTASYNTIQFPVQMRAVPSLVYSNVSDFVVYSSGSTHIIGAFSVSGGMNQTSAELQETWADAIGAVGAGCWTRINGGITGNNAYLGFSAEL